jgi:serine beta-lactamase-like protein LACTB, mitochondrial
MTRNFIALMILFFYTGLYSQNITRLFEDYLINYYINKNVPSISAGISVNGKMVWVSTKGFSDLENSVPANNKTLYRIASISKSITAVAVMQLAESGKINLDQDARKYIPYIPVRIKPFTVRQLMNHSAGIRTYRENEFDSKTYFASTKDVVLYILKDTLEYTPGDKYVYSTLGYNLLAAVIENVSGLSYADYMKKFIFEPSGMANTIPDFQRSLIQNRARGYVRDSFREIQNAPLADLSIKYAGGGLLSNSEDILKFCNNLLNGKLIKPESLDSMLTPTRLNNGKYINYGLGFSFDTDETGRKSFSHSGGGTGFTSRFIIYPSEKIASVFFTNIRDRQLDDPAKTLIYIYLGKNGFTVKRPLSDRLMDEYIVSSIDSVLSMYMDIAADSSDIFDVSFEEIKYFGYDLINIKRAADAIQYFKLIISENPGYSASYVGLADAYYADGNRGLALKNFRTALRLDPNNTYASNMIKKINSNR